MYIAAVKNTDWIVAIGGVRDVEFSDVDEILSKVRSISGGTPFQLFNADLISGWKHLYYAAVNAVNAFTSGAGISRSLSLETLLYASCQNQISSAFKLLWLKPGDRNVAVMVFGKQKNELHEVLEAICKLLGVEEDKVLELNDVKILCLKKTYGISDIELATVKRNDALTWLIVERGALLRR